MNVNFLQRGDIHIVEIIGEMNSDTSNKIYETIISHIDPREQVVLDMTKVRYVSSAGIRALLLLYRSLLDGGGKVVLVGLSEELEEVLSITGFLEFFQTQHTVDAAVRAIQ
jgi:anti-sigma B factor antagonist